MIDKSFVKNLRAYRKEKDLTQAKLAEMADISHGYYQQLEAGGIWPSPKTIESLAGALGVPEVSLFRDVSSKRFEGELTALDISEIVSKLANTPPVRRSFVLALLFQDKSLLPEEAPAELIDLVSPDQSKVR